MENLSCSPYLYRKTLRPRRHAPVKAATPRPNYKFYFQPQDTLNALQTTIRARISQVETGLHTYLTQVESRVNGLRTEREEKQSDLSVLSEASPKQFFFPPATQHLRSVSDGPKAALNLARRKVLNQSCTPRPHKDSLTALLCSEPSEEDLPKLAAIADQLRGEELPAPCLEDLMAEVVTRRQLHDAYHGTIWRSGDGADDPLSVFSHTCGRLQVAPVPVLAKVTGRKLVLNRYQLQPALCEALSRTLPGLEALQVLHLDANDILDVGGAALVEGLWRHGSITSFYYTRNEIGPLMLANLRLLSNSDIVDLSLRGCRVAPPLLPALVAAVLQIKELAKLSLSELGLSELAVTALCQALSRSKVTSLDLSWNQISLGAAIAFLRFLKGESKLQELDFSWNSLASADNEAACLLMSVLRKHPTLMHLNLSHTQLSEAAVALVVQGLQKSLACVCLHLTGNAMEGSSAEFVRRHLEARTETQLISHSAATRPVPVLARRYSKPQQPDRSISNIKIRDRFGRQIVSHRDNLVNIFHSDPQSRDVTTVSHILSRLLGHPEVANGEQWVHSQHCWVCERWSIFTFAVKESGLKMVGKAEMLSSRLGGKGKVLFKGSMNNWLELPMHPSFDDEFALSLLLPPGLHKFWVLYEEQLVCTSSSYRTVEEEKLRINEVMVPLRTSEVQVMQAARQETLRVFDKAKSVFHAFIEDSDEMVETMLANDMRFSKIGRVVKKEVQYQDLMRAVRRNFAALKEVFDYLAASSNYPTIGPLDFMEFCRVSQVIDKRFLKLADIDVQFTATNVGVDQQNSSDSNDLSRYEFFEIVVRLAITKYQDLELAPSECLEKLLQEHIFKYIPSSNAAYFRSTMHSIEMADTLEVNLVSLQSMFAKYKEKRGKLLTLAGVRMMLEDSRIQLPEKDVTRAFIIAKMSISDEAKNSESYKKMTFVEFLYFLGKLGELVITDDSGLVAKVEKAMDLLFAGNGLKRKAISELHREEDDY